MFDENPQIITERKPIPNVFPPIPPPEGQRIAIIGEAPGEHEELHHYPFVGPSGHLLNALLAEVGVDRNRCFVGNVCQVRPPQNNIEAFAWEGTEIQQGLAQLRNDIATFNPHICVLLGGTALRAGRGLPSSISAWRGSLFTCNDLHSPLYGRKCIASYHPAYILRDDSARPLLKFDLSRAVGEATDVPLILPYRELITSYTADQLCHVMDTWPSGLRCSVDIEGGLPHHLVNDGVKADAKKRRHLGWRCVSICGRPTKSFTIAWWKFTPDEHARVLQSFARLMHRRDVPKVLQNSLYDAFVMAYGWRILVRNIAEDTMLKGWEVYCELPKSLGVQASIWTREPHWKDDEMYETSGENLALGCAKDTAVTLEICDAQDSALTPAGASHYRINVELLNPLHFMELRGIRYDIQGTKEALRDARNEIEGVAKTLCDAAGVELRGKKGSLSSQRLAKAMYEVGIGAKRYPPQYKKEKGRKTEKLTTDVEAILSLRRKLSGDAFLDGVLRHRHLEGIIETLSICPDADGRVRCGYNIVGTETGRLTCYTSPTGAGANLTTITKKLRVHYLADPGYDFFQCDLSGADGWTVAAHCARLGDPTMLLDYEFGLKPAKLIGLMEAMGPDANKLDRESLAFWSDSKGWKSVNAILGSWVYDGCKVVQHGTNYRMKEPTMCTNLMKNSFKRTGTAIYMEQRQATKLQSLYLARYHGVSTWHTWAEAVLRHSGELTSASGHTRVFFGRRTGHNIEDTLRQFLADEPQQNTTWATNLAMHRLWNDPDNRIVWRHENRFATAGHTVFEIPPWLAPLYGHLRPGHLVIEPLHQVHDALCGQWPKFCADWARAKVKSYFNNTLKIADRELVIPFEGNYGPSWGAQPYNL